MTQICLTSDTKDGIGNTMNIQSIIRRIFNKPCMIVRNDSGERIESLRFTVPALRVGVLEYAPGQLTTNNKKLEGKTVKLYYPPEAVSSEKFLKSLQTAPVVVGGHDSTTNEENKKIDGWAHTVGYDESQKAAIISGVVKGKKQVAYIKDNLKLKDFGASAFIDIFDMEIKSGVTPDGQEYNAIAKELKATHVALAEHVRDPENKIKVTNAVVVNTDGIYKSEDIKSEAKSMAEMTLEQIAAIVKNAVKEELSARNTEDEMKELKNKVKNLEEENEELKKKDAENCSGKGKNAAFEGKETAEEEKEEKKAEEGKDDATLENAKPTQALIAAVGNSLNIDFGTKTPSFASLANMLGIKEEEPAARIIAVNSKYAELIAKKPATAGNTDKVEVF